MERFEVEVYVDWHAVDDPTTRELIVRYEMDADSEKDACDRAERHAMDAWHAYFSRGPVETHLLSEAFAVVRPVDDSRPWTVVGPPPDWPAYLSLDRSTLQDDYDAHLAAARDALADSQRDALAEYAS